jgi:hypothetical protein
MFVFKGDAVHHELPGQVVRGLASDRHGGALAIIDGNSLRRRTPQGDWNTIAKSSDPLSCCVAVGDVIYAGTDDAHVLRVSPDGQIKPLPGFDTVVGRDTWYAGSAVINGRVVGPPLGIRSITATSDGAVLLANVHVGGIPRSTDGGLTWEPTIDIDSDVHEVVAHPTDPRIVIAAAAVGLCISRDSGATWTIHREGLHASYCSAVAFLQDDILVAASADHFATQGAVYRRPIEGERPLTSVGGGFPTWINGIADTGCIATLGPVIAIADKAGNLHVSGDSGRTWTHRAGGHPNVSSVLVV